VERLIGSIRRECVDHIIVLGEAHLRRILKSYADYYNGVRTHRSLNKDAPVSRPVQRTGVISSRAILRGLHHHYAPGEPQVFAPRGNLEKQIVGAGADLAHLEIAWPKFIRDRGLRQQHCHNSKEQAETIH
jgi:Integrase core domain